MFKKFYHIFVVTSVLFLYSARQVQAASYYVDSLSGKDSNTGTTEALPYKTLFRLNQIDLNAGDTVFLKSNSNFEGPLVIDLKDAGNNTSPVVITSYSSGNKPVISDQTDKSVDGITAEYDGSKKKAVEVYGGHIKISKIKIENATDAGIEIFEQANNIRITQCDFRKIGFGITIKSSKNVIEQNTFDEFNMVTNTADIKKDDVGAIAINLNADAAQKAGLGGITGNIITKNTVHNAIHHSHDYGADGGFVEIFKNVDDTVISYNKIYNSKGFIEIGGSGEEVNGLSIFYNLSYHNYLFSFVNYGTYGVTFRNYHVYNNVIYEPDLVVSTNATPLEKLQNSFDDKSRTPFWFDGPTSLSGTKLAAGLFTLRNNIIVARTTISNREPSSRSNNIYYKFNLSTLPADKQVLYIGYSLINGDKYVDPQFVDPSTKNFKLKSGSRGINSAYNLGSQSVNGIQLQIKTDLEGYSIPYENSPDIGAYEFH